MNRISFDKVYHYLKCVYQTKIIGIGPGELHAG